MRGGQTGTGRARRDATGGGIPEIAAARAEVIAQQTTGIGAAGHLASRIIIDHRANIAAEQATHAIDAGDRSGRIVIVDSARTIADQAADKVVARHVDRAEVAADRASLIGAHQGARVIPARNAAPFQADIAHGCPVGNIAEQAGKVGARAIHHQARNGMAGAVEAAAERAACSRADRNEGRAVPHIAGGTGTGGIDILLQRVVASQVHCHQLQLVRRVDIAAVLGRQHRPGGACRVACAVERAVGIDHDPVIARCTGRGRESKGAEIRCCLHLRRCQASERGSAGAAVIADTCYARVHGRVVIPASDHGTGAGSDTAEYAAQDSGTAWKQAHRARRIHIHDRARTGVGANHAAHGRDARYRAGRVTVFDNA